MVQNYFDKGVQTSIMSSPNADMTFTDLHKTWSNCFGLSSSIFEWLFSFQLLKSFFDAKLFLRNSENTYYIQKLKIVSWQLFKDCSFSNPTKISQKNFYKLQMLVVSPFLMDFGDPFSSSDDESNRFFFDFLLTLMGESIEFESSSCLFGSFKGEL